MYQFIHANALPQLGTYENARAYHAQVKPFRGKADKNVRPLRKNRRGEMTIRLDGDDVVCTYHWTDVVRFRPNGDTVITGYPSLSTEKFADALLVMPGTNRWAANNPHFTMRRDTKAYSVALPESDDPNKGWSERPNIFFNGTITIRRKAAGGWEVVEGATPVVGYQLDRKITGPMLKETGYSGFQGFWRVYNAMRQHGPEAVPKYYWQRDVQQPDPDEALAMLRDESRWKELADSFKHIEPLKFLRDTIYQRAYDAGEVFWKEVIYAEGGKGYRGVRNVLERTTPTALWG